MRDLLIAALITLSFALLYARLFPAQESLEEWTARRVREAREARRRGAK